MDRLGTSILLGLIIIGFPPTPLAETAKSASADLSKTPQQQAAETYGKLPLSFEMNMGQTNRQVEFLFRGRGYTLFLTRRAETVLVLGTSGPKRTSPQPADWVPRVPKTQPEAAPPAVLRMKLLGAKRSPQAEGLDELPGKANYFIGNDPKNWRTNVPMYAKVKLRGVYPGVDLMYYGNQRQLEEDFIVAPGADVRSITVAVEGAERLSLNEEGDLMVAMKNGEVRLQKPVAYQEVEGVKRELPASYRLKSAHQVGFQVAAHDESRPLIIDPVVVYSTYLGGNDYDIGLGIAADAAGNAYLSGYTFSANFPTTAGAFQTNLGGSANAFVTKLNSTISGIVYSTYLGGSGGDASTGIAVDASGNAYVTGSTSSTDFPTTPGAVQPTYGGAGDVFVTKLDPTGSTLLYSTYLGGSGDDASSGIAVDTLGNVYVTGYTSSTDFPATPGAFQKTYGGGLADAFVAKVNPTGNAPLLYSTYLGGSDIDIGYAIAVDAAGNAYVSGHTASSNFPTTSGAFQTTLGGSVNAFVTKLNPTGSAPLYSTYLGGSGMDAAQGIAVDSLGNAYVSGYTDSGDFPTTLGAFQTTFGGGTDAFVTKLNPAGIAPLIYSTYLGGSGNDVGYGIAVDAAGNAYVTGYAGSADFPTTAGAFQTAYGGGSADAFVTALNPTGSAPLLYSTLIGGSNNDGGQWIALDPFGSAYVAGFTISTNFPTTPGAFQTTYGGGLSDAFVTKFANIVCTPEKDDDPGDSDEHDRARHGRHSHDRGDHKRHGCNREFEAGGNEK